MTARSGAWTFATVGMGLAIAGAIGTAVVRYLSPAPMRAAFGFGEAAMLGYLISGLTWASIGALLVIRRPENAVGWLMVLIGVGYALSQLSVALTFAFAAEGTAQGERLAQIAGWVTVVLQLVGIFQLAIGFIFPTGHAQSSGWARLIRLFWAFAGVFVVISLFQPGGLQLIPAVQNPFGFGPDLRGDQPIAPILTLFSLIIIPSLGLSMVSRYRAAGRVERQQLKWFVLALSLSAIGLGIALLEAIVSRPANGIGLTVYVFAGAVVPVAIGVAILRYRLFEIDRIISRTIAYAVITAVLASVFIGAVLLGSALLGQLAEGQTLAYAGSTLLVFALFGPMRRRAQSAVDRRFDRAHYDSIRTVDSLSVRLRGDVDLGRVEDDVLDVVARTLHPARAVLWLRPAVRRPQRPS